MMKRIQFSDKQTTGLEEQLVKSKILIKYVSFGRPQRKPIDFEQYLQQISSLKDHFEKIINLIKDISNSEKLTINEDVKSQLATSKTNIEILRASHLDLQGGNIINYDDPNYYKCIDRLEGIHQLQIKQMAQIMVKQDIMPLLSKQQKRLKEQFINIFLDPSVLIYGQINSRTIQYQKMTRYNTQIDVNNMMEINAGQWLSNSTIDFVCDYFMEKQLLEHKKGDIPNLIIPYRIFTGYDNFQQLDYFTQIKTQYSITKEQSIFHAFKYIGIPINVNQSHWVSIVIDTHNKKIHVFDSLRQPSNKASLNQLHNVERLKNIIEVEVPGSYLQYKTFNYLSATQKNGFDCGIFVLKFLQAMMNNQLSQDKLFFGQEQVNQFRKSLYYLIPMIGSDPQAQLDLSFLSELEVGKHIDGFNINSTPF